jgi:sporulation protein YlmC with PRC-barrel domain
MRTQAEQLLGARVIGSDGKVIGTVEQVFRDDVDGTLAWARVRSGKTGRFVPLGNSQVTEEGLRIPFDSPKVMNGPSIEAGQHMSAAQAEDLSRYYGLTIPAQPAPREQAAGQQAPSPQVPSQQVPAQEVPPQQGAGMPSGQYGGDATRTRAEQLLSARVTGSDGRLIGTIEQVFRDDVDGTPAWARIRSGEATRFVPLGNSQVTGEGLRIPFDAPRVMNGPGIEAGQHMSAAQCDELSRYYGLTIPAQGPREQAPGDQALREQAPGQQAAGQEAPYRQAPAQEVRAREFPSQQGAGMPSGQYGGDATRTRAEQLLGTRVTGSDGMVLGTFEQVFRDDVDGTPAWARIRSGETARFVPLGASQVTGEGLRIPFDSPKVMNSPNFEAGQHMSAAQCDELSRYYGLSIPSQQVPGEQPLGQQAPAWENSSQQRPGMPTDRD